MTPELIVARFAVMQTLISVSFRV